MSVAQRPQSSQVEGMRRSALVRFTCRSLYSNGKAPLQWRVTPLPSGPVSFGPPRFKAGNLGTATFSKSGRIEVAIFSAASGVGFLGAATTAALACRSVQRSYLEVAIRALTALEEDPKEWWFHLYGVYRRRIWPEQSCFMLAFSRSRLIL